MADIEQTGQAGQAGRENQECGKEFNPEIEITQEMIEAWRDWLSQNSCEIEDGAIPDLAGLFQLLNGSRRNS